MTILDINTRDWGAVIWLQRRERSATMRAGLIQPWVPLAGYSVLLPRFARQDRYAVERNKYKFAFRAA